MDTQQGIAGGEFEDVQELDANEAPDIASEQDEYDPESFYQEEGQGEEQGEGQEADADGEGDAAEPIEAPISWSKEDREHWSALPREVQEVVQRREAERDKLVRAKTVEAAQTRQTVENEAREIVAKLYDNHAIQLQAYAQQLLPPEPDRKLLYSNDPNEVFQYHRQKDAYEAAVAQQRELHQQIAQSQAAANAAREQSHQAELASDAQRLKEQLPEWFDPSTSEQTRKDLQEIGAELGYSPELMAEASSTDILALNRALSWKRDAEKYRKLMSKKMSAVSKARFLPKVTARPGSSAAPKGGDDILKTLYPND